MAFETSSYASSFMQSVDAPKELLLVLSILNEKQQQQRLQRHHQIHKQSQQQKQKQKQQQSQQHMEWSQIELIYRAEGNANLVLALPQFKKVLRLPKFQQNQQQGPQYQETEYNRKYLQQQQHSHEVDKQQKQQQITKKHEPNQTLTTGQQQTKNAVGILTMDHYVAYISIIRCLLGNEFVFEAHIVGVSNPNDRDWINEHIKPYRPANRLDKEFGGQFGLLLPDATLLPAEFDISFFNLQSTTTKALQCCSANNIFGVDTYAVEIKPKQGWLLPNDVNNLFDIKPTVTTEAASTAESEVLNTSTDNECFTTTQNRPSQTQTQTPATTTTTIPSSTSSTRDDKISQSVYSYDNKVDIRCRYCSMQFLKLNQQKINKRSHFCPIDLFSGVTERMFCALDALFACPQNNLRVFRNGNIVFDDQLSGTSKIEDLLSSDKLQLIKHLLVACLLREYCKEEETACASEDNDHDDDGDDVDDDDDAQQVDKETPESKDGGASDGQPQSSVTPCKKPKIHTMPTTTTTTTVMETEVTKAKTTLTSTIPSGVDSVACSSSTSTHSVLSLEQINKAEVLGLPKNSVLHKLLHLQLLAKKNLRYMVDHEYALKREKTHYVLYELLKKFTESHNQLDLIQLLPEEEYLLAATALDCSIMITFNEIGNIGVGLPNNRHVVTVSGRTFLTKVTLLDLDPKPDTHFAKYCQQTKEIDSVLQKL